MSGEVIEGAAGGGHVDEPEERGAQLLVVLGELHGLGVERLQGVFRAGGEGGGQRAAHAANLLLQLSRLERPLGHGLRLPRGLVAARGR